MTHLPGGNLSLPIHLTNSIRSGPASGVFSGLNPYVKAVKVRTILMTNQIGFKKPPTGALVVGVIFGTIAVTGAGLYLYELIQTSLMAGGTRYAVKVPPIAPQKIADQACCQDGVVQRWIGCSLP